jgi:LPXTG-motif cell wall-anchored protein
VAAVATTTTTSTIAPIVEPAVIEAGNPAAPAVEAAPAPTEEPAPLPVLPRTGSGIDLLAGFGGLAVAAGGVARYFGRRRPAEG